MIQNANATVTKKPEYAYHLLRGALDRFQKSVPELNEQQFKVATQVAERTFALESIVLASPEAVDVMVGDADVTAAVAEIASRYADHDSFLEDLNNNGLNEDTLRNALSRELLFNAVMDRVSVKIPSISELDIQIFYQLHADRFTRPETRKARHILITVNDEYPENTYSRAVERLQPVVKKLRKNPGRFKDLARKYSECPTALEGGKLGELSKGKLYPELDTALFAMDEGEVSDIIETEIGLHVLYCEKVHHSVKVSYSRAKNKILQILEQRQRKACQKAWLEKLHGESV